MDVRLLARRPVATGTFLKSNVLQQPLRSLGTFTASTDWVGPMRGRTVVPAGALATMVCQLTGRLLALGVRTLAVSGLSLAAAGM